MWSIRTVKSNGRKSMKKNFTSCLIISLIMVVVISGFMSVTESIDDYMKYLREFGERIESEHVINLIDNIEKAESQVRRATSMGDDSSAGVISGLYHSTKKTGSAAGGIILILDKIFFKDDISTGVVRGLGTLFAFMFTIFIRNNFRVGAARFFIENRLYSETHLSRILFVFKVKRIRHCSWVMLTRIIFNLLWLLTIVGGVIKFYSYRMIPYILAENPDISRKEAFILSMKMMKRNKFRTFLLDLTFVPWWILSVLTFGLVQYLYLEPYMRSAYAELYMQVREDVIENELPESVFFTDKYLNVKTSDPIPESYSYNEYPAYLFTIPAPHEKKTMHFDYHRHYSLYNLILIFFIFAIFGWLWECALQAIKDGTFINRGSLYGPWTPIYGIGGTAIIVLLKPFINRPIVTFFMAVLVCGVLEGGTAWFFDAVMGVTYWDYSNFYFNINGYVCLEGLLVFGLGGCMFLYLLAPMADTYLNRIPKKVRITMCVFLSSALLTDLIYTHFYPHMGKGIGGYTDEGIGDGSVNKHIKTLTEVYNK